MKKYPIKMSFQVSDAMKEALTNLPEINVAAVCRKALQEEIDMREIFDETKWKPLTGKVDSRSEVHYK